MEYTFDQAAARLDIGRNKLASELRRLKMLDQQNQPTGPLRGKGLFVVQTGTYKHPTKGKTTYTKTLITEKGLKVIQFRLEKGALLTAPRKDLERFSRNRLEEGSTPLIPPSELKKEETMNNEHPQIPTGRLHDVGELTVINDDHERCHHRVAMVVVFDSPEQAQACVEAGSIRLIPSMDLNPDVTEAIGHGG